jgi:lambda family phage minor tail protein L
MAQQKVLQETYGFTPTALLELWVLDGTAVGLGTVYYFCNGLNTNFQNVTFNNIVYSAFPIKVDSMDMDGKGSLPHPKLTVSNINGFVSNLLLQNGNLVGATVIRRRIFARFIDASNFNPQPPWSSPDPTAAFPDETFQIYRKVTENQQIVQWELASPLETQNVNLPRRTILANNCVWNYRDFGTCGYGGVPIATSANKLFGAGGYGFTLSNKGTYDANTIYNAGDYVTVYSTLPQLSGRPILYVCMINGTLGTSPIGNPGTWQPDSCSKTVAGCKLRFGTLPLRGSFFPGVTRAGFINTGR